MHKSNMYSLSYQLGDNQEVIIYKHDLDKLKEEMVNLIDHFCDYEDGSKITLKDPNGNVLQSI